MERINLTEKLKDLFAKYKFVLLILCVGILLMSLPNGTTHTEDEESIEDEFTLPSSEERIEAILGQIAGVGKVSVLLTEAAGAETIYQVDEDRSSSTDSESLRLETVIVTNSDREEAGLVRTVTPPVYLGAIIVCQGGDIPSVKLAVVQAVSNVTGISSDRITVLKMK